MARILMLTLSLLVFVAAPSWAETTSDVNHKGYTEKKGTYIDHTSKEKIKYTEFNTVRWKDVQTKCKPCEALVKQYNRTVQNLFYARTQVASLKFNTTREGIERIKGETSHYFKKNINAEAAKLGAVLEFVDLSKETLPKAKQLVTNLEILEEELRGQIGDCEKQCIGEEREIIIKDPKALVLPYDWKGPYVTTCPEKCQKLADYLNGYPARTYPLLVEQLLLEASLEQTKIDIKLSRLAAWSARSDDLDIIEMERDLKVAKANLKDVNAKIDKIKRGFKLDLAAFEKCEKECKPVKKPKKTACVFPESSGQSISIGPNSEFGTGAAMTDKVKGQAKGAAMGALNGLLGGSGIKLGGGGGSKGKGPKTVKDPTFGELQDFVTRAPGMEHVAGVEAGGRFGLIGDDTLIASVKLEDVPGNGTFHAMWLEDSEGKITLPREYMIFSLYQDWKLTVWWTYDRYIDGEHVEHDEGEEVSFGRDELGSFALWIEGTKNAIWSQLGFGSAVKGVKHIGAVFPVSPAMLSGACPQRLVTHVSLPKMDPVVTQALTMEVPGFDALSAKPVKAKAKSKAPRKTRQMNE